MKIDLHEEPFECGLGMPSLFTQQLISIRTSSTPLKVEYHANENPLKNS